MNKSSKDVEDLEMINRAYELMRNINEIVGENTNYDEALRVTFRKYQIQKIEKYLYSGTSKTKS